MQDAEIVAAIVAGQADGLAAAYDRYAPTLYGYCRSLLGEPAYADDAVVDTFIIAAAKVGGLRDPGRLRPWLYAVARNECRRLRFRAWSAPVTVAAKVTDDTVDLGEVAQRADRRALVGLALAGLSPGDREIIELNLRHELTGQDLADTLGVSDSQAQALASRARSRFEASLGAMLVARIGRESCPELAALVPGGHGRLNILVRKRINRHIEQCETCGKRRSRELTLAMMLSMLPAALVPYGLRDHVLGLIGDPGPTAVAKRAGVIARAGQFGPSGFPRALGPPRAAYGPNTQSLAAGAAVAAVAVVTVVLFGAYGANTPSPFPPPAGRFAQALAPRGVPEVKSAPAAGGGGSPARPPIARINPGAAGLSPQIAFTTSGSSSGPTPAPVRSTPAPSPTSSSPSPVPSTASPSPAPSTPSPAPSSASPAPSSPAPDPSSPVPDPSSPAPDPSSPAPAASPTST
ncbi:MAG TPA: sigma-70 family RNA polymerase sigma factor [Streptosporangiaceae bacterium]|nr:sigma-70 family RNA polymerase sigma factor [Streptosporangiaceae bacterium]